MEIFFTGGSSGGADWRHGMAWSRGRQGKATHQRLLISWVLLIKVLLLSGSAPAETTIVGFEPGRVAIDARVLRLEGSGLDLATTATLFRGERRIPLPIIGGDAEGIDLAASLLRAEIGSWGVHVEGPSIAVEQAAALTLWRPNRLQVLAADSEATIPFPLPPGARQGVIEFVLSEAERPPRGVPSGIELLLSGSSTPVGGGWARWRAVGSDFVYTDDLSITGGWSDLSTLSSSSIIGESLVLFPGSSPILPESGAVILSLMMTEPAPAVTRPALKAQVATAFLTRTAAAESASPEAPLWNGAFPTFRQRHASRPAVVLRYRGPSRVRVGFEIVPSVVQVGEPVQFLNTTTPAGGFSRWDLDGDGLTDLTESSPTVVWQEPGVYTIELIVRVDETEESLLCRDCVTVLPAPNPSAGSTFGIF